MALQFGLVPDEFQDAVLKNLVEDILVKNEGHLSTGIIGCSALERVLGELGRADVMFTIATKTTYPSWGYSISKGATTVWESFEKDSRQPYPVSLNMKMFGSTEKFFYRNLAGIGLRDAGFKHIQIKPCVVGDVTYAKATRKTVRGLVAVDWTRADASFEMKVRLPLNTTATVGVPKLKQENITITESGKTVWKDGSYVGHAEGTTGGSESGDYVTFDAGSGAYLFQMSGRVK